MIENEFRTDMENLYDDILEAVRTAPPPSVVKSEYENLGRDFLSKDEVSDSGKFVVKCSHLFLHAFVMLQPILRIDSEVMIKILNHELDHYNRLKELGIDSELVIALGADRKTILPDGRTRLSGEVGFYPSLRFRIDSPVDRETLLQLADVVTAADTLSEMDKTQLEMILKYLSDVDTK